MGRSSPGPDARSWRNGDVVVVIVTTETAAGYRVERAIEMVWGEGHNRLGALEALRNAAEAVGGNGVLATRWAQGSYAGMPWREGPWGGPGDVPLLLVYGTAVVLHRLDPAE
jgi:uncharacterized protein YbjQ (UPF0145 family)